MTEILLAIFAAVPALAAWFFRRRATALKVERDIAVREAEQTRKVAEFEARLAAERASNAASRAATEAKKAARTDDADALAAELNARLN
jgi:hypothetical protein